MILFYQFAYILKRNSDRVVDLIKVLLSFSHSNVFINLVLAQLLVKISQPGDRDESSGHLLLPV